MGIGIPELLIVLVISSFWLVPVAAGVWALMTLQKLRAEQRAIQLKLETIERLLQRS